MTNGGRKKTRQVKVGNVAVGGGAPISVQSMTTTKTADIDETLAQIYSLAASGADIVRCTANSLAATEALATIVKRSPVPIVADVHNQHKLALAALEAGVACLRLNPGNIRKPAEIKAVASEAKDRNVPIRIGVNGGSLPPEIQAKHGVSAAAMVASAVQELEYFDEVGFDLIKVSLKSSHVPTTVEANTMFAELYDIPLHLGVTEAGPPPNGTIKSTAGIASLLMAGIGDTIRYSLTADPVQEVKAAVCLLESLDLRERRNVDLIACPSCGRAEVDVFALAEAAQAELGDKEIPLKIAVMGCVVNGPGEAREADLGIAAGNKRGHLFVKGVNVAVVKEDEMVSTLVDWAEFICENGTNAALTRAKHLHAGARTAAAQDAARNSESIVSL